MLLQGAGTRACEPGGLPSEAPALRATRGRPPAPACHRGDNAPLNPTAGLLRAVGEDMARYRRGRWGDGAASPVIGVILMVGTTVILGASVYTWTSQYANVPDHGVKVLALAGDGPLKANVKAYVVAASMPGLRYEHVELTLDGDHLEHRKDGPCANPPPGTFKVCRDGAVLAGNETALPGDRLVLHAQQDQTLRVIDAEARFVILSLTVD